MKSTAVLYGTAVSELWFFTSVENSRTFEKKFTKYNSQLLEVLAAKIIYRPHHIANLKTCTEIREKNWFWKIDFFHFFTKYENSRTFWQIWKPALRYEKKRHIFCRIGRIRLRIAWDTIWSMAHLSRRVSDNSQKKKISKILTNSTKCRTPLPLPKSHSGSKIFFRPNFFLG